MQSAYSYITHYNIFISQPCSIKDSKASTLEELQGHILVFYCMILHTENESLLYLKQPNQVFTDH